MSQALTGCYKERFFWALDAHAILDHVNGIANEPADPVPAKSWETKTLSNAEKELDKEWKKEL